MLLVYAVLFIIFTVLLYRLFFGLRETLYFFNMINPYKMLFFFILTDLYLLIQIWLMWELAQPMISYSLGLIGYGDENVTDITNYDSAYFIDYFHGY